MMSLIMMSLRVLVCITDIFDVDNLQLPSSKSKGSQSKSRKRRPFLIRKFEGTTPYNLDILTNHIYLSDVYKLSDEVLGQGARSLVIMCYHRNTDKQCAVKV